MRRPALIARSTCSRPCVSTRPPGSKTRIFRRCGYSAARRPRLSHMLPMTPSISGSESPGKARLMLRRACRVTGRRGPMARPSAPPKADAQSSGKTLNTPNRNACSSPGHQSIGDPGRPSGKVRCGLPCARDQLRNSGGKSFSAPQAEQIAVSTATRCPGPMPDAITKPQLPQRQSVSPAPRSSGPSV